jgi:hypothetical protein
MRLRLRVGTRTQKDIRRTTDGMQRQVVADRQKQRQIAFSPAPPMGEIITAGQARDRLQGIVEHTALEESAKRTQQGEYLQTFRVLQRA